MPNAPSRLRSENLDNPLGIDASHPRLSWQVEDPRPAEVQTAYRILAASDSDLLESDVGDLWDTGRVDSAETFGIVYGGVPLNARERVFWKIKNYDSDGNESPWSQIAFFEAGLDAADWEARWISAPVVGGRERDGGVQVPAFRCDFTIDETPIRARLYVTALGLCDVEINGERAMDSELAPGWTDYTKRLRYQTFDVTALVDYGKNAIGALLGDGWYCGAFSAVARSDAPAQGAVSDTRQHYGDFPELLLQLEVTLRSGRRVVVSSSDHWKWRLSHIIRSDFGSGERVDMRQVLGPWSRPDYDDSTWFPVTQGERHDMDLDGVVAPPIRVVDELEPIGPPEKVVSGMRVRALRYDLGGIVLGRARIVVTAPNTSTLEVGYAVSMAENGTLQISTRDYCTVSRVAGTLVVFEARFTHHRFRYLEISGDVLALTEGRGALRVSAVVTASDLAPACSFDSDSDELNRLHHRSVAAQRCAFLDVPQIDLDGTGALGWIGAASTQVRTAAVHADVLAFYTKWLIDVGDSQVESEACPPVAPLPPRHEPRPRADAFPSGAAVVRVPWDLFLEYGDEALLTHYYPKMRAYLAQLEEHHADLIVPLSDGVSLDDGAGPGALMGTVLYSEHAKIVAKVAEVLGDLSAKVYYGELTDRIREAFRQRFLTSDGYLAGATRTAMVAAVRSGMLETGERERAVSALTREVESDAGGFVADIELLDVLVDAERLDLVYRLLIEASRAVQIEQNYSLGVVAGWLYRHCAGLDVDTLSDRPRRAYGHVRIHPRPPLGVGFLGGPPLTFVEYSQTTVRGKFRVAWELNELEFMLRVAIPPNCSATVVMPDGETHLVSAGSHGFRMALTEDQEPIPVLREVTQAASGT